MHDNRNHIGPNWTARAPRTLAEAFPRSAGPLYLPAMPRRRPGTLYRAVAAALLLAAVTCAALAVLGV